MPLILHRRVGLQQTIADWAKTDIENLNITTTYNVVHGSPVAFVENDMGYFLTTRDLLAPTLDNNGVFRPLSPKLEVQYTLVWKRRNMFSKKRSFIFYEERYDKSTLLLKVYFYKIQ